MPTVHDLPPKMYERVIAVRRFGWRLPESAFDKMKGLPVNKPERTIAPNVRIFRSDVENEDYNNFDR